MTKYTPQKSIEIEKAILNCEICRLVGQRAIDYVKERTGITFRLQQINRRKAWARRRDIQKINLYRKDDDEYRLLFAKQLDEADYMLELWHERVNRYNKNEKDFFKLKQASDKLKEWAERKTDLGLLLPRIDGAYHNNDTASPFESANESLSYVAATEQAKGALSQAKF